MRSGLTMILVAAAVCAGCATNVFEGTPKRTPVAPAELLSNADTVLDYASGTADSLPLDLFGVSPLADTGKDTADEMQKLADEMRLGYAEIGELKALRVLGEDNRGYLALRGEELLESAVAKNTVQKAMAAENDRRKNFYRGLAHASEEKGLTLTRVERAFAARRLARSLPGAMVQLPSNDNEFESYRQSPLGKQQGDGVHPGDWIELP